MFENADTHPHTHMETEAYLYHKLTNEPKDSGEPKIYYCESENNKVAINACKKPLVNFNTSIVFVCFEVLWISQHHLSNIELVR